MVKIPKDLTQAGKEVLSGAPLPSCHTPYPEPPDGPRLGKDEGQALWKLPEGLWRLPNVKHSEHQPWAQFRGKNNANDTLRGSEEQAFNTRLREEEKERPTHGAAAKDPQRLPPSGPLTPPKLRRQSLRSLPGQTKRKSALTSHPNPP